MRYGVAALIAVFMLFAGIALAGAGHGWMSGGFGCFALTPIACSAWVNVLNRQPSLRGAIATLAFGLVFCLVVAIATISEGFQYFFDYWRASGIGGILVGGFAYLNWVFMSVVAIFRAQRVPRLGT
jgi:hypothetical protein